MTYAEFDSERPGYIEARPLYLVRAQLKDFLFINITSCRSKKIKLKMKSLCI